VADGSAHLIGGQEATSYTRESVRPRVWSWLGKAQAQAAYAGERRWARCT